MTIEGIKEYLETRNVVSFLYEFVEDSPHGKDHHDIYFLRTKPDKNDVVIEVFKDYSSDLPETRFNVYGIRHGEMEHVSLRCTAESVESILREYFKIRPRETQTKLL